MYMLDQHTRHEIAKRAVHPDMKVLFGLDDDELAAVMNAQAERLREVIDDPIAIVALQTLYPLMQENKALQELGLMGHLTSIPLMETVDDLKHVAELEWSMDAEQIQHLERLLALQTETDRSLDRSSH